MDAPLEPRAFGVQKTSSVDLRAAMVLYLDTLDAAGRAKGTLYNYRLILTTFLSRLNGQVPTDFDVREFLDTYRSASYRVLALTVLRQWFHFLRARRIPQTDPTEGIPFPEAQRRNYASLSEEDFLRFRDALPDDELRVIATVLFFVGSRIRETLALRVEDVAFDGEYGSLDFRRRKGGQAGFAAFGPEVESVMRPWLAGKAGRLFKRTPGSVRYHFERTGGKLSLPGVIPHRLRFAFIQGAVEGG